MNLRFASKRLLLAVVAVISSFAGLAPAQESGSPSGRSPAFFTISQDALGGDWLGGAFGYQVFLSADGSTLIGFGGNANGEREAFRWTAETGVQGLGHLGGGRSEAWGVSADGSVIVGNSRTADQQVRVRRGWRWVWETIPGTTQPFIWTEETGMVSLGAPDGASGGGAWGVSADGTTIVGASTDINRTWVWNADTGFVTIDDTLLGGRINVPQISADGTTVTGYEYQSSPSLQLIPVRWTAETGVEAIGDSPLFPTHISADGQVIAGNNLTSPGFGSSGWYASDFVWTADGGMLELPVFGTWEVGMDLAGSIVVGTYDKSPEVPIQAYAYLVDSSETISLPPPAGAAEGDFVSAAIDSSELGIRILGAVSPDGTNWESVLWDTPLGEPESLVESLALAGVDTSGYLVDEPRRISRCGEVIFGLATDLATGERVHFVAVLPFELPDDGDADDGDDEDPVIPLMTVDGVVYSNVGLFGRDLRVTVGVLGEDGPVADAFIDVTLHNLTRNRSWNYSGTTDESGLFSFQRNRAPSGFYAVEVHSVEHPDYEWDGEVDDPGHQR